MYIRIWILILALGACLGWTAHAQQDQGGSDPGSNALYEIGAHLGDLLPNQIPGVTEIIGLGGVRAGFRLAPNSYAEGGVIMGNGSGVSWKNVHVDLRMDIPVENLVGLAYVGLDSYYYKGVNHGSSVLFGGHVGGGLQTHLVGNTWFRSDMKFGFHPGTSLYIGFGLVIRFGDGGTGS